MAKLIIRGPKQLNGEITISGAKNSALPILISTVLLKGDSTIKNIPNLTDIDTAIKLLRSLGLKAEFLNNTAFISGSNDIRHIAPYELITKMRASFFVAGPIVARVGMAKVPYPGGCSIGSRPVNIHLRGLEAFGIKNTVEHGFVFLKADKKLKGTHFKLDFPSVGATENLMMTATLAEGETILKNVAKEPEIIDLANFLNEAGAKISGAGTSTIIINGVKELHGVSDYNVIPDRIETATYVFAAALTRGNLKLHKIHPDSIQDLLIVLDELHIPYEITKDSMLIKGKDIKSVSQADFKTGPFPEFSTDIQPLLTSYLATSYNSNTTVTETIFENRFMHIMELNRMGADIKIKGNKAIINGKKNLSGTTIKSHDLRGGAALLISAIAAEGETILFNTNHIHRGYERIEEKLRSLGADIEEY